MRRPAAIITLFFTVAVAANASSIFSPLGVGVWHKNQTAYSVSVAGANQAITDSIYFPLDNPAGWRSFGITRYTAGIDVNKSWATDGDNTDVVDNYWFPSAAITVPIYRTIGFGVLYQSMTDADYLVFQRSEFSPDELIDTVDSYPVERRIQGDGGLSKAGARIAMQLTPKLGAGIGVNYYFGEIEQLNTVTIQQGSFARSGRFIRHEFSGIGGSVGLLYELNPRFRLGATIKTPAQLEVTSSQTIEGGDSTGLGDATYQLPFAFKLSGSREFGRLRTLAMVSMSMWEDADREIFTESDYANQMQLGVGFERLPLDEPLIPWYEFWTFRAGFRYEQHYVQVSGNPLETYGVSFGLGIPIARERGMLDLAFWYDIRSSDGPFGTDGPRERIFGMQISVSSSERWFHRVER